MRVSSVSSCSVPVRSPFTPDSLAEEANVAAEEEEGDDGEDCAYGDILDALRRLENEEVAVAEERPAPEQEESRTQSTDKIRYASTRKTTEKLNTLLSLTYCKPGKTFFFLLLANYSCTWILWPMKTMRGPARLRRRGETVKRAVPPPAGSLLCNT
jgi:hypothetical protein